MAVSAIRVSTQEGVKREPDSSYTNRAKILTLRNYFEDLVRSMLQESTVGVLDGELIVQIAGNCNDLLQELPEAFMSIERWIERLEASQLVLKNRK